MAEHDDEYGQQTVELALSELQARRLPVSPERIREQLPGLEPERQVTDWGRSERVEGLLDRTLYGFLYHYWFRVEVEGIENVPLETGALIVANHCGVIPADAAMIAKAIREEHPRGRVVHLATEQHLAALPGIGMLLKKLGTVASHPANVHRLLFDERQLVLVFPEGRHGRRKSLKERYRVQAFERDEFVASAIRARVPIVPLAVLGAEESAPMLASLHALGRLPRLPISAPLPLPAKFRLRFLEPVNIDELAASRAHDPVLWSSLSEDIRALIQENLLELVASRRSVWLG
jgi:1-acyl-sn-glycerol-3-phosphate acyltransferase